LSINSRCESVRQELYFKAEGDREE